jgi:hypothetical protein
MPPTDPPPNPLACWSCSVELHKKNVGTWIGPSEQHYVPICSRCWEELTVAQRVDFSLRFDARLREIAAAADRPEIVAVATAAREVFEQVLRWYPHEDWADRIRGGDGTN